MSTDKRVTENLVEVLQDGADGFADAAEKLRDSDRSDLAPTFDRYANQRREFAAELERMAAAYGDDIDEDGSVLAKVHRVWMAAKDALAGSDPDGVLDTAEQGEDHAIEVYEDALEQNISANLRETVQRQLNEIRVAHADVKSLRDAT